MPSADLSRFRAIAHEWSRIHIPRYASPYEEEIIMPADVSVETPNTDSTPRQQMPKFKIGDIVIIKPYTGNSNSTHNINLSKCAYEEVRRIGKLTIDKVINNIYNQYGNVYSFKEDIEKWIFHESCLVRVNQKIKY